MARLISPRERQHIMFGRFTWIVTLLLLSLAGGWIYLKEFEVKAESFQIFLLPGALLLLMALALAFGRFHLRPYAFVHSLLQLLLLCLSAFLLSHLAASLAFPLSDKWLAVADRKLGFDWMRFIDTVNGYPALAAFMAEAYGSLVPQVLFVMLLLIGYGRVDYLQHFVLAFAVALLLTLFLTAIFPAQGGYLHYAIPPELYPSLQSQNAMAHAAEQTALRDGSLRTLSMPMQDLITFPSFRAAVAVLLIYASLPLLFLGPLSFFFNGLVIASTIVLGGHYLTSVLVGVLVAVCGIVFARLSLPVGRYQSIASRRGEGPRKSKLLARQELMD